MVQSAGAEAEAEEEESWKEEKQVLLVGLCEFKGHTTLFSGVFFFVVLVVLGHSVQLVARPGPGKEQAKHHPLEQGLVIKSCYTT